MPERLADPWYDAFHQVRRVRDKGEITWRGEFAFISEAVVGELGWSCGRLQGHRAGSFDNQSREG